MTDWDDFHKQAARDADARIVARGGRSVFGPRAVYTMQMPLSATYRRPDTQSGVPEGHITPSKPSVLRVRYRHRPRGRQATS